MMTDRNAPCEGSAKVVLLGCAGAGKAAIVKAVAEQYARGSARAGELGESRIYRTEFFWPHLLPDGGSFRVRLFAVCGQPEYNAVCELLVAGADGIALVGSLARRQVPAMQAAFRAMVFNARHRGVDLLSIPVVLHYRRPAGEPACEPEELDQILGVPPGAIPRFVTGPDEQEEIRSAVEWIVAAIANRADARAAPSRTRVPEAEAVPT